MTTDQFHDLQSKYREQLKLAEQLKRADELRQQMAAGASATPATQDATPAEPPAPAPTESPAVQPAQETPTSAVEPTAPSPVVDPAPAGDQWEHKYRVLQGIHQADVQRARDLAEQNRQLRDLLTRMEQAAPAAPAASAPQAEPQKYSFVKPEEVDEYGADLLDLIDRKAKERYLPMIEQLQNHVRTLEQRLGSQVQRAEQVATVSAKDTFFAKLDSAVPYWEQLNTNPGFLSWLDTPDDFSGIVHREMFNRAYQNFDHIRVAKFFEAFAAQSGVSTPTQHVDPVQPDNTLRPIVPAEQLTTPAKANGAPAPVGKKIWTRQEIAAFYESARKGAYKGKEAERRRVEVDIFDAGREGRIK